MLELTSFHTLTGNRYVCGHNLTAARCLKFKMLAAAVLKIHKQVYLGQFLNNLHQISSADTYCPYKGFQGVHSTRLKFKWHRIYWSCDRHCA